MYKTNLTDGVDKKSQGMQMNSKSTSLLHERKMVKNFQRFKDKRGIENFYPINFQPTKIMD